MKIQFLSALCLALAAPLALAQAPQSKPSAFPARTLNVAVLIYPGMNTLDATGPLEVFDLANDIAPKAFNVYTLAQSAAPIAPHGSAFSMTPLYCFANAPRPDIVIVPGASLQTLAQLGKNRALLGWVRSQSKAPQLMSVCTGSFLLGSAGVLDGRRATTHWFMANDFHSQFPRVTLRQNVRFVEDGNVLTTAGVSSGIDGALRVVEKARGTSVADTVARVMQYRPHTPAFPLVSVTAKPIQNAVLQPGQKLALDFDPVCHMKLSADDKATFAYKGQVYGFCSSGCRDRFAAHPEQFLKTK